MNETKLETTTLAAGCFWCYEAIFRSLEGIQDVLVGYAGGEQDTANYEAVSTGETAHAEAFQITFNPQVITFHSLLEVFWYVHDPTTKNRQGNDIGPQYRSAIFYHDDAQKQTAEELLNKLNQSGEYQDPIVTEIVPFKEFFKAEDYHQRFFERNPNQAYCTFVIKPKFEKFKEHFAHLLK